MSVNKAIVIGRLGKDPEVRFTGSGAAVASFSLATDESYKNKDGEKVQKTEWHNLVVWGNSVEAFVQKYLHKGDLIYAEGKLQTRSWDDKDGNKRYTTEINVTDIKKLSDASGEKQNPAQNRQASKPAARPASRPTAQPVDDDDIPF